MQVQQALEFVAGGIMPADFGRFRQHIDPVWIQEALAATGTASVRRRRLPADQVVWLVLGMGLLRNESIDRVVTLLDLALPSTSGDTAAKSGIARARQRLGDEPMAHLFAVTADHWVAENAERQRWRGLSLYGMDGSTLRVPDSAENRAEFGGQTNGRKDACGYPMVRVVAIMALRSHLLSSLRFADYGTGEVTLADQYWQDVPDQSLTIVDRGFLVADDLTRLARSGEHKHWLTRAKSTTRLRTIKKLGRNDSLVEIELSDATRRAHPELPAMWQARAIKYQRKGFRPSMMLTSLCDAERYPAGEIVNIYHERWEIEIGFDEVKTHLLDRQETIRSRSPAGVRQEIWGIALAYNLVRLEMVRAAAEAGVEPNRISFVNALSLICHAWLAWSTQPMVPGRIPKGLLDLRRHIKLLVLPPRRRHRTFPRAVKIKMSNYARKRPRAVRRK